MNLPYEVNRDALAVEMHLREFYHDIRFGEWNYASDDRWAYKRAENALALIVFSSQTGVQEVHGGIAEAWLFAGGPDSPLGLPTTWEEYVSENERKGNFQHGSIIWQQQRCQAEILAENPLPRIGNVISSGYPWMVAPGEPDAIVNLHKAGLFISWANGMGMSVSNTYISETSLKQFKVKESHLWRYVRQHATRKHLKKEIKMLAQQCNELNKDLSLWREFDMGRAARQTNELASRLRELADEKSNLLNRVDERAHLKKVKLATRLGGILWKISGRLIAKMIDRDTACYYAAEVRRINKEIAILNDGMNQIKTNVQSHNAFDWIAACIRLGSMQSQYRRAMLKFLKVDTALRKGAERIRPFEKEIIDVDEAIVAANKELEDLMSEMENLKCLILELSLCSSSYERKKIHCHCYAMFGDGNPDRCLQRRRSRETLLRGELAKLQSNKRGLERNIRLTLGTANSPNREDKKSSQASTILCIDGSNVVLDSDKYGWLVLKTLLDWLNDKDIDYHLYFDASIEYEIKKMDEKGRKFMAEQISDKNHTTKCPSRDEADKFILYHAEKFDGHVISNDGYKKWEVKYPWVGIKNNTEEVRRVHKFTVVGNMLSVPDLDIFEKIVNS